MTTDEQIRQRIEELVSNPPHVTRGRTPSPLNEELRRRVLVVELPR